MTPRFWKLLAIVCGFGVLLVAGLAAQSPKWIWVACVGLEVSVFTYIVAYVIWAGQRLIFWRDLRAVAASCTDADPVEIPPELMQ